MDGHAEAGGVAAPPVAEEVAPAPAPGGADGPPIYRLGLALAGAISAGAYTAGVFDFLIQALDEWERRRDTAEKDLIPNHRVAIWVMSGASAGAITGALGAVALAGGLKRTEWDEAGHVQTLRYVLPRLYAAWVEDPAMVKAAGPCFLSTEDLEPSGKRQGGRSEGGNPPPAVRSLLNAGVVDALLSKALTGIPAGGAPLPYVAKDLDLYFTLSNLRGVPYAVTFANGSYGMRCHADRVHFHVHGLGAAEGTSPFAAPDGLTLDVGTLRGAPKPPEDWAGFGRAAVASGAFPGGLASQPLQVAALSYAHRPFTVEDYGSSMKVSPRFPPELSTGAATYRFVAVDGGMLNNEPFEYARCALLPPGEETRNPREGKPARASVVMIDPFPDDPILPPEGVPGTGLLSTLKALFPALIAQSRFKPEELLLAGDSGVYSRYMLQPSREPTPGRGAQDSSPFTIACGLTGGFGGFLERRFRDHDFQLGRRNCQMFLRSYFSLPEDNPFIAAWSAAALADDRFSIIRQHDTGPRREHTVIPLLGTAADEVDLPAWPRMTQEDFETLKAGIRRRALATVKALIAEQQFGFVMRLFARIVSYIKRDELVDFLIYTVLADLVLRDQIEGWQVPAPVAATGEKELDIRRIAAALLSPGYELRSVPRMVRDLATSGDALSQASVTAVLEAFVELEEGPYASERLEVAGGEYYRLTSRRRRGWKSWPGISLAYDFVWPVSRDDQRPEEGQPPEYSA